MSLTYSQYTQRRLIESDGVVVVTSYIKYNIKLLYV